MASTGQKLKPKEVKAFLSVLGDVRKKTERDLTVFASQALLTHLIKADLVEELPNRGDPDSNDTEPGIMGAYIEYRVTLRDDLAYRIVAR